MKSRIFTSYCVGYDIHMLIQMGDEELLQAVKGGTPFELRAHLCVLRAQGVESLIIGHCDRQTPQGRCQGHPENSREQA